MIVILIRRGIFFFIYEKLIDAVVSGMEVGNVLSSSSWHRVVWLVFYRRPLKIVIHVRAEREVRTILLLHRDFFMLIAKLLLPFVYVVQLFLIHMLVVRSLFSKLKLTKGTFNKYSASLIEAVNELFHFR